MQKPVIYGDEGRFRAAVTRAINRGDDLLAQVAGVRKLMEATEDPLEARGIESGWEADFRAWFNRTGKALHKYLRESLIGVPRGMRPPALSDLPEVLPVLGAGLPPDTGKPRHVIHIDEGEEWLRKALDELRELQSALVPANRTSTKRPATEPPAAERHKWPSLAAVGAVASIIGVVLAVVLFFYH